MCVCVLSVLSVGVGSGGARATHPLLPTPMLVGARTPAKNTSDILMIVLAALILLLHASFWT